MMAINLWLGLYNAPGEWPWTYMFLVVLQLIFVINPCHCSILGRRVSRSEFAAQR